MGLKVSVVTIQHHSCIYSHSVQFSSVTQSCLILCDCMNCSTLGLPVYHQLMEFTQTHVHRVGDGIQPSSVVPFSSCLQSLPASESFPMSQLFAGAGQSTGVSALASVLSMNTQDWSPLGWTGWISLQSKGLSGVFSNTTAQKHQFFGAVFFTVQLSHPYMTIGKTIALTRRQSSVSAFKYAILVGHNFSSKE